MNVSNILMKKEIEYLQRKIKDQEKEIDNINSIKDSFKNKVFSIKEALNDKVTLLNYSDKVKIIRAILINK